MIGGSPCTHWSIAQKQNRETEAEGIGWELFKNYLLAKEKFQPDFFLYENNQSATQVIKNSISNELKQPLQYINSALVSAQSRKRFYCHNFGNVPQPVDKKIYLCDILSDSDLKPYNGGKFVREKNSLIENKDRTFRIGITGASGGQAVRVYDIKGKSPCLQSQAGGGGAKTGLYLWDDEKIYSLNAKGAEKLQTLPSGYLNGVSGDIGIAGAGNGWTADVIIHLLQHALSNVPLDEEIIVLSMYDGIGTGRYCFDKLGYKNIKYYAYEINKNAIKIAMNNYSDIVQCGDAFQIREENWNVDNIEGEIYEN